MPLTDQACKKAKAKAKAYKLHDANSLYLLITPKGAKSWRVDYRLGKRRTATLGLYPDVPLAEARDLCRELRKQVDAGIDPALAKRQARLLRNIELAATFEKVAREWHEKRKEHWTPRVAGQVLRVLERNLFPELGSFPIKDITPVLLLAALRQIEKRGKLDLLADVRSYTGQIFRYAIATQRAERDIAADLRDAFKKHKPAHFSHLSKDQLPAFLRALYGSNSESLGVLGTKLRLP